MNKLRLHIASIILVVLLTQCQNEIKIADYKKLFDEYDVTGCFILKDLHNDEMIVYNPDKCDSGYLPASTFKIPHALIALETQIAPDGDFKLKWDKKIRGVESWNRDHTLMSAIKYSAVWYFIEIANLIGEPLLKEWLEKIDYGNKDISGNSPFWLYGNLRITPNEQMDFISKFYFDQLPFSKRNIQIVKNAILVDEGANFKLYAKTGWADANNINTGWMIGYLEKGDHIYLFVTNVQSGMGNEKFAASRAAISKSILSEYTGVSFNEK